MSTDSPLVPTLATPPPSAIRMTYEEFLAWHPESAIAEWVDGEAYLMPPPGTIHQKLAFFLARLLMQFVETHDLGEVIVAPYQMRLSRSGREPDVLFIARENLDRLGQQILLGPADLAVEVVSGDSGKRDRREKYLEYEHAGVREYWIIDPSRRTAEFYSLGTDARFHAMLVDESGVLHSQVLSGLWVKVDWLWQDPLPKIATVARAWNLE